jgi:hypothetical protein
MVRPAPTVVRNASVSKIFDLTNLPVPFPTVLVFVLLLDFELSLAGTPFSHASMMATDDAKVPILDSSSLDSG